MGDLDPLTPSQNARTLVKMIERFYVNRLTPETSVAKLQSIREQSATKRRD
jgi:hypothetical protein